MLHVALLDEPVERGVDDKLGVPPVEPSGQPGLEQLPDAVWSGLVVVALQGQRRPALLCTALDRAEVLVAVLVQLDPGLLRLRVLADEVLP